MHKDKLDPKDSDSILRELEGMKELLKKENASASEIKTKLDSLNTAAMKLGEIMYKQNQDGAKESSDVEASSNDDVKAKEEKDQADGKNKKDLLKIIHYAILALHYGGHGETYTEQNK